MKRRARSALLAGSVILLAARVAAAGECPALPTPVYVTGSTAAKPLLMEIGKVMAAQTPPVTVVYLGQGSCAGVDAIVSGTPITSTSGTPTYWDTGGAEMTCDITVSVVAHIGISDVFA